MNLIGAILKLIYVVNRGYHDSPTGIISGKGKGDSLLALRFDVEFEDHYFWFRRGLFEVSSVQSSFLGHTLGFLLGFPASLRINLWI